MGTSWWLAVTVCPSNALVRGSAAKEDLEKHKALEGPS